MKLSLAIQTVLAATVLAVPSALANPATLPNHPGYPMSKSVDPVHGQPLANDPGQSNAVGDRALTEAALSEDAHVKQNLSINRDDQRILEKPGAGLLPKVQGPKIVIAPPVTQGTKVEAVPK